jgi:hypothetical protein
MTIIDEIKGALGNYPGRPVAICLGKHQFDRYCEWLNRMIKSGALPEVHEGALPAREVYYHNDRYVPIKRVSEGDHLSIK